MVYELKKGDDYNYNCISFFCENGYSECVSSLCFNEKYKYLLTANGTRHYPKNNNLECFIDLNDNNKNEKDYEINNMINNIETNNKITEDDRFVPSNIKLWKFK